MTEETGSNDLLTTINSLSMGIVVLDRDTNIELVNTAFFDIWDLEAELVTIGDPFRKLIDLNKDNGVYAVGPDDWEEYVAKRVSEVKKGNVKPRELERADGKVLMFSVTNLSQDRRLISYFDVTRERKQTAELEAAQEKADKKQQQLSDAIEALEDGFVFFDEDDRMVICNQAFRDQFKDAKGVEEYLVPGVTYRDMTMVLAKSGIIPGIEGKEEEFVDGLIEKRKSELGIEKVFQTHDGRWIKQRDKRTNTGGIVGVRIDVTELKERETELFEAFQVLDTTSNSMPQGLIVLRDLKIVHINPQAYDMLNLSAQDVYHGQAFDEFLQVQVDNTHIEFDDDSKEKALERIKTATGYVAERLTADGRTIKVETVPEADGVYLILYSDITDSRQQEEKLRIAIEEVKKNEETFKAFAETNSDWFWKMDKDLRFSYASQRMEAATGVNPFDIIGKSRRELVIPGVDKEEFEKHISDLEAHKSFRDFVHPRIKPDGEKVWIAISGTPIFNEDGVFDGYVGSGRDVTESVHKQMELEEAKKAAESAERAKSEFLANMSHEIRTPMNGVMGMAELLATTELDAKQAMFTDVIVKSGASLLTIINDILDFSKIDAGQLELEPAPFDIREAIEDVATLVSAKVAEKDLELIVRVNPKLPNVMIGDVGRFRQVITNLLGNAVKFTEKGHIYVNVEGEVGSGGKASLRCSVEDTGIGIPEEKCRQIFQKFNQADTSATRKHEGTGLGLSIASSLVGLMGGEIQVTSKVGHGSKFYFDIELPVDEQSNLQRPAIPGDMTGARILIVDDNEVNRSILSEQMSAWRFDSAAAESGEKGLETVKAVIDNGINLDAIVLDYQMPGMSGADFLQKLRSDMGYLDIPVIMLTSVDSSEATKRCTALGAEATLTKPTRSSLLLETIMQVIANSRARAGTADSRHKTASSAGSTVDADQQVPRTDADLQEISDSLPPAVLDVLVAEDNEVNQIVFRQILEETGVDFNIVENGRLAVSAYRANPPRMILMDVSMPEMNGKEATLAIRAFERDNNLPRVPIVGVTAHALKGDMEQCLDAGMDDYLSKPVSPTKLEKKIQQWLKIETAESKIAG